MINTACQATPKNVLKPPLKWAGGKRWLVPHLGPIWQAYITRRLVEPFCGGLSVTLGLMPACALLNDSNEHLINFYKKIKGGLNIDILMENDKDFYYGCRDKFNKLLETGRQNSKEAAELFYYLNRAGYNGLCRFNRQGYFNVPFGRYKAINPVRDYSLYKDAFASWDFSCVDFEELKIEQDDFIYADPPYDVDFTQYNGTSFSWKDQLRLGEWLTKHNGPVVLSNQATDRIIDLYKELGFKLKFLNAPRMISCTGNRTPAREVLATKNL